MSLLTDYLKAECFLTINESTNLRRQVSKLSQRTKEIVHQELKEKDMELQGIREHDQMNMDEIEALSDQVTKLMIDIEMLKRNRFTSIV